MKIVLFGFVFRWLLRACRVKGVFVLLQFKTKFVLHKVVLDKNLFHLRRVSESETISTEESFFGVRDKDPRHWIWELKIFTTGVESAFLFGVKIDRAVYVIEHYRRINAYGACIHCCEVRILHSSRQSIPTLRLRFWFFLFQTPQNLWHTVFFMFLEKLFAENTRQLVIH